MPTPLFPRLAVCALLTLPAAPLSAAETDLELWRLDCGNLAVRDLNMFSDTLAYPGESTEMTDSCYLIRHGQQYMLWDAGLPIPVPQQGNDQDAPVTLSPGRPLTDQLAEIGLEPQQIAILGISHAHFDHMGQAADFPDATLLIGADDWAGLQAETPPFGFDPTLARPWLEGGTIQSVPGDHDVFGDGSVIMLRMPGHTRGQAALLVHLPQTGPVLLSADVVHFRRQLENDGVPPFNADRADSLASIDRLRGVMESTGAQLVIQHDAGDIGRLPAWPASAR